MRQVWGAAQALAAERAQRIAALEMELCGEREAHAAIPACSVEGAVAWGSGARNTRRTVLRETRRQRAISRTPRPCSCKARTAWRISAGIMAADLPQEGVQTLELDLHPGS